LLQILIVAFGLSTDAFAASVAKGIKFPSMSIYRKIAIALGFGLFEALAPLIGYLAGKNFEGFIKNYDHWIAFILLFALGARMIWKCLYEETDPDTHPHPSWRLVLITAMSTSIDAVIIGMTLSLLTDNVPLTLMIIGATTFTLTLTGLHLGGKLGAHAGQRMELAGGVGLIGIGAYILFQHIILA